ncbi:response regulator [Asticcacaulis sp.]|uniref:response regulator n=1 Tax=Asticcacaulis sp. TaxID=1872648 RepID=UPI002D80F312|nr:response regulator [Asticcacaulis sp.]
MQSPETNKSREVTRAGTLRVLIVDDDASCANGLAEAIEEAGAATKVCLHAAGALTAMRVFRPDLILLDLEMPDLSGFDIASTIRTMMWMNSTKLIAISGHNDEAARRSSAKAGFDLHLSKPIKLSLLEDILDLSRAMTNGTRPVVA